MGTTPQLTALNLGAVIFFVVFLLYGIFKNIG